MNVTYGFRESYFEYFESCNISGENTNIYVSVFMVDLRMINKSSGTWLTAEHIKKNPGLRQLTKLILNRYYAFFSYCTYFYIY
jgi:hypothetical protein